MSLFQIQRIELAVLPTLSLHPGELHDVIIPGLGTYSPHVIVHGALRVHKHLLPAISMKMLGSYHSKSSSIKLRGFNQVILIGKQYVNPFLYHASISELDTICLPEIVMGSSDFFGGVVSTTTGSEVTVVILPA